MRNRILSTAILIGLLFGLQGFFACGVKAPPVAPNEPDPGA